MHLRTAVAMLAFVVSVSAQEPTFTFTSESGKSMEGHFSPGGTVPIKDADDGTVYSVETVKIDTLILTARTPPTQFEVQQLFQSCGNHERRWQAGRLLRSVFCIIICRRKRQDGFRERSEEHTSELKSLRHLV